jgi:hypothetical protein
LILLVLGIKGCLNARTDRAFRSYAADVNAIVQESNNLATNLFTSLSKPRNAEALDVQNEVNALATDAEQLVQRAKDTSHPGELSGAHGWVVTTLELRRDALKKIAQEIPTALGQRGRKPAIDSIAGQMQAFLASDVIYSQKAIPELERQFRKRGVSARFRSSHSLPDLGWLDPTTVDQRLSNISGTQKAATPGIHGTGLQAVSSKPSGTQLSKTGVNRIAATSNLTLEVQVQNQGQSEETNVPVSVAIKDGKPISLNQKISRIGPGELQTISIPITPKPETGAISNVTVAVSPVPGEKVKDNNQASYQVVFTPG